MSLRSTIKKHTPWPLHYLYRKIYYFPQDAGAAIDFIFHSTKSPTSFGTRFGLVARFYKISYYVDCPHTEHEMIVITRKILNLGPDVKGVIAEAGAFHGGSTAKLSLVAALCGRTLDVFDSFEGMPQNEEAGGASIYGRVHHFPKGSHAVGLEEVRENVAMYGDIARCRFHKGWLADTLRDFHEPVACACMNVDLAQSTKDCLKYFYPLAAAAGGIIISQDAHFPWIIELLRDGSYWKNELHVQTPPMEGLGVSKFVTITPLRA
jgi:O-methyltransferase